MASKQPVKVSAKRGGKKAGRKMTRTIIEHGANGGHTVKHEYERPKGRAGMLGGYEEPEQFPFSNKADTMHHLDKTLEGPSAMGQQAEPDADEAGGASDNDADNQGEAGQEE